jgi:hypothetical protein
LPDSAKIVFPLAVYSEATAGTESGMIKVGKELEWDFQAIRL